jgi:hypothetical protein
VFARKVEPISSTSFSYRLLSPHDHDLRACACATLSDNTVNFPQSQYGRGLLASLQLKLARPKFAMMTSDFHEFFMGASFCDFAIFDLHDQICMCKKWNAER